MFSWVVAHMSLLVLVLEKPRTTAVMFVPAGPDIGVRVREGITVKAGQAAMRV